MTRSPIELFWTAKNVPNPSPVGLNCLILLHYFRVSFFILIVWLWQNKLNSVNKVKLKMPNTPSISNPLLSAQKINSKILKEGKCETGKILKQGKEGKYDRKCNSFYPPPQSNFSSSCCEIQFWKRWATLAITCRRVIWWQSTSQLLWYDIGFPTILTQRWPHAIGADVHLSKVARYVCVDSISLSGKI